MSQAGTSSEIRELAQHLVAFEAASGTVPITGSPAACQVCEKLRRPLVLLAGTAGFSSLLRRALTLAQRESPALSAVRVQPDGSLEGLADAPAPAQSILVGHLLGLLITFIGEALTLRLLNDVWPDFPGIGPNSSAKESK